MKKLFICALVAGSLLFASCGGSSKKAEEKPKAEVFAEKFVEAESKGDMAAAIALYEEVEKYVNSLSDEERAKFEADLDTAVAKLMAKKAGQEIGNQVEAAVDTAMDNAGVMMEAAGDTAKEYMKVAGEAASEAYGVASEVAVEAYNAAAEATVDAYNAAAKMSDDKERADALLFIIETVDKLGVKMPVEDK